MDYILYILISLFCGYWIGVVSGYGTKVRTQDKSKVMTVRVNLQNGIFYFWDMSTDKFISQNTDKEMGLDSIRNDLRTDQTLVTIDDVS